MTVQLQRAGGFRVGLRVEVHDRDDPHGRAGSWLVRSNGLIWADARLGRQRGMHRGKQNISWWLVVSFLEPVGRAWPLPAHVRPGMRSRPSSMASSNTGSRMIRFPNVGQQITTSTGSRAGKASGTGGEQASAKPRPSDRRLARCRLCAEYPPPYGGQDPGPEIAGNWPASVSRSWSLMSNIVHSGTEPQFLRIRTGAPLSQRPGW